MIIADVIIIINYDNIASGGGRIAESRIINNI